jgi:hypothetical protein
MSAVPKPKRESLLADKYLATGRWKWVPRQFDETTRDNVYVDTNTVMLTSAPAPGDTLRFYGLVFNDHGTLRMDCARISPGVTGLSQ